MWLDVRGEYGLCSAETPKGKCGGGVFHLGLAANSLGFSMFTPCTVLNI